MTMTGVRQLRVVVTADDFEQVEVGQQVSPHIRLAFEVDDTQAATARLAAAGAEVIGGPAVTPWNSLNSRLRAPADVQLTLFEPGTATSARA